MSSVGNNKTVDYNALLERIVRAERVSKMDDIRKKSGKTAGTKTVTICILFHFTLQMTMCR